MNHEGVLAMLEGTNLPVAYSHFAEGEAPKPPFICFTFPTSKNFSADNIVYVKFLNLEVELYSDEKSPSIEALLEAIFTKNELFWEKSELWIESEKLYEVLYQIAV